MVRRTHESQYAALVTVVFYNTYKLLLGVQREGILAHLQNTPPTQDAIGDCHDDHDDENAKEDADDNAGDGSFAEQPGCCCGHG